MFRPLCAGFSGLAAFSLAVAPTPPAAAEEPLLRLVAATGNVVAERYPGDPGVALDLGLHLAARERFELRVRRPSYGRAPEVHRWAGGRYERLPDGLVKDFSGLPGFLEVKVIDKRGRTVARLAQKFCPAGVAHRVQRDAAPVSPYPESCPTHPFTLGTVWGVQRGWALPFTPVGENLVDLKPGKYRLEASVARKYRRLLDVSGEVRTIGLTVRAAADQEHGGGHTGRRLALAARDGAQRPGRRPSTVPPVPQGPKPDLRALPAWDITVSHTNDTGRVVKKRDYLRFSTTVWNAGPSRLVVDGFRREGSDVMDAYQYFYDADGTQTGHTRTGTFEWEPKSGHEHWHFRDFAAYRLLSADGERVVRGRKEAFCLANTDQIDLTVEGANPRPENTDLSSSCGQSTSVSLRQALEAGSGDTYEHSLPGQSFDVTKIPNGVYRLEVTANPARRLVETDLDNNVALRRITLGGRPGARTVEVERVGMIKGH
ncbi:lysyl oxidase family protein [Actinocorallia populi]|uniref:lysyl oxidase family protein n=1 Tax=Actinocorallia populi TaxID=2079200 RepID=UPI000D091221|nr:lysyl oxidase family protein [Actinocorallia populi]